MPNIKSAIKRVKVNEKKNLRNRMVKKYNAILASDPTTAVKELSVVASTLDKAAAKGIVHKNAVNRKKARLAKALNKASA